MQWEKCGLLWAPSGDSPWAKTHATIPVVQPRSDREWWIYLSIRDGAGKSHIGRILADVSGTPTFRCFDPEPVLSPGLPGTFDDSGVMPSWIVEVEGALWMYYVGWNVPGIVSYRLSIGLAVSDDRAATWRRYSQGPVMDRNIHEPYFVTSPCVVREVGVWRMWYCSCESWRQIKGRWEPRYYVKLAESADGVAWNCTDSPCLDIGAEGAVARPFVYRDSNGYKMVYSRRLLTGYREERGASYRLGYAESDDGINWRRRDGEVGIAPSVAGWDSEMMAYGWLQRHGDETYLLYNGNGFGRSGVGVARLI